MNYTFFIDQNNHIMYKCPFQCKNDIIRFNFLFIHITDYNIVSNSCVDQESFADRLILRERTV